MDMIVIGLTGGIGTGKSEVARILQGLGAVLISADQVGHEVYKPHSEIWQEVVKAFGEEILQPNGEIDRRKLGSIVFSHPQQLARLNQIMHPRMAAMVARRIEELREEGVSVVVVEAALLFEAGWDSLVDEVWATDSTVEAVTNRLQSRNGLSEEEITKRINSQMPAKERLGRSNVVIDNSGDVANLERIIQSLWNNRVKEKVGKA
jgi:dephospho-CoA kinase